jgi:hypothetical protein
MMAILAVALGVIALIALSAFGLVLVLARRLRSVTERVNAFLPLSAGSLPLPGTPIPEFQAVASSGQLVSQREFAEGERVFAMLSTECEACYDQLRLLREVGADLQAKPIVVIAGPPSERHSMVAELAGVAVVLEEPEFGPIAEALEISEFPAVMLIREGYVQAAEHALGPVLAALTPAATL